MNIVKKWLLLFFVLTLNSQLITHNCIYAQVSDTTSYLKVSDRTFPANGIAVCTVTVTVKTDTGVPLQGKQVTIYSSRGSQDTITQPTTTDSNGQCTGTIKSEYCGGSTVTARCNGNTIVENLVPNPSFEDGTTGWDMNSSTIDSSNSHTGTSSSRLVTTGGNVTGSFSTNFIPITNNAYSTYEVSGYIKANVTTGNYYFLFYFYDSSDAYIAHEDVTLLSSTSDWVFASRIYGGSGSGAPYTFPANCTQVRILNNWWNESDNPAGTGWVDDFRFRRIPTINFTGTRFKITIPARTTTINNPSPHITIETQDGVGNRDTTFNGTVTLQTSTASGTFSLDRVNWANTGVVTLVNGEVVVYYKDSSIGNPTITVSRAGFTSDTRVVSIVGQGVNETASYITFTPYQVPADGTSVCSVVISINDTYGFPITNKLVTLQTTRGNSDTILDSMGVVRNTQTTNVNGVCTFTIRSGYAGWDTITARCDGNTITRGVNKYGAAGIWHFDTDTKDVSGYGNNGTIYGALWTSVPDSAAQGSALQFDGIDDYVDCGNNASLDMSDKMTLEMWANVRGNHSADWTSFAGRDYYVVSAGLSTDPRTIGFQVYGSDDAWHFTASYTMSTGWHHIVGTFDNSLPSNNVNLYVDGVLRASANYTGQIKSGDASTFRISSIFGRYYNGLIDEVKIYNRALSEKEIKASYESRANIYWTGSKFKITTPARTTTINNPSPYITVEAQDGVGNRDTTFNGTVTLQTSTASGTFSLDRVNWANTGVVTLVNGEVVVYYKDSSIGNPAITVSRSGYTSDTQTETILAQGVNETASYITFTPYQVPASGVNSATTVVTINDTYGFPIANKLVTLQTTRGNSDTILDSMGVVRNTQTTNVNGVCTFTIRSGYAGWDTITARCDGNTITRGVNKYGAAGIWHFDTDTKDVSGYANNGTLYNGTVWTTGRFGSAVQFDGVDDNITVFDASSLQLPNFSLEIWFKAISLSNSPSSGWNDIIGKHTSPTNRNYLIYLNPDANHFIGGSGSSGGTQYDITSGVNTTLGEWYHVVLTNNGSGFQIYVNGDYKNNVVCGNADTQTANLSIGCGGPGFNGILDGIRIYNHALSADEVKASYESRANIYWTGSKFKITTPARTTTINNPSPYITVEVQDGVGNRDTIFNDTVLLSPSSPGGKFSLNRVIWADTTTITLSSGQAIFYYKDSTIGNPVITVSRSGYTSDTQIETILNQGVNETASYITFTPYQILADGTSVCSVVISINDTYGFPIANKLVTLQTTRGNSDTINDSLGGSVNPQTTNVNGQCTGTIKSEYCGGSTVTARCDGNTIVQNLVPNPSFEDGTTGWDMNSSTIDSSGSNARTGISASRLVATGANVEGSLSTNFIPITNNAYSTYEISGYIKANVVTGHYWFLFRFYDSSDAYISHDEVTLLSSTSDWVFASKIYGGSGSGAPYTFPANCTQVRIFNNWWNESDNPAGTGWVDDFRFRRIPTINFTANKLKIVSPPFTVVQNLISPKITVIASDIYGNTDIIFNDTINIISSSGAGKFSLDGTNWSGSNTTSILLSSGIGNFYYKDSSVCSPTITVSRAGLLSDVQQETITENTAAIKLAIITPSRTVPAGTASDSIVVQAWMVNDNKDSTYSGTCVFLSSATGRFCSTQAGETWTSTITLQMVNGETYVYYKNTRAGSPVITVTSGTLENTSQVQSVSPLSFNNTSSYITFTPYQVKADGSSTCTAVVTICDIYGNPLTNKLVTLQTARGNQDTITAITPESGITNSSGQCTFTVKSGYSGLDTIAAVVSGYPSDTITRGVNKDGAVGIWHFDTDIKDVSGYGNNAVFSSILNSQPLWTSAPDSSAGGSALYFDGKDDYVRVNNSSSLEDVTDGSYSFEAWAKPMSVPPGTTPPGPYTIIGRVGQHTDIHYRSDIRFAFETWNTVSNDYVALSAATYDPGSWYHIVGVLDLSAMKVYIYVNGTRAGTTTFVGTPLDYGTNPYYIGCAQPDNVTWPYWFHGIIDEVKIYNRALSEKEIKASYESRTNIYFNATKLGFITPPLKTKAGSLALVTIGAGGSLGGVDTTYPNTTVLLSSSSNSGSFLSDGNTVTSVTLSNGQASFYYRDYKLGNPVITLAHTYASLDTGTQVETVAASLIKVSSLPFTISTINTSPQITMVAQGYFNETDVNFRETVSLSSSSSVGKFSVSNTTWRDTSVITFSAGFCTFYYKDRRGGNPTIAVLQPELALSAIQSETVIMPVITISKQMKNERTGISGALVSVGPGDTIEYTITIKNDGTETAIGIVLTDTVAFDTNNYSPLAFVSMDTADTYAYTTDPLGVTWITGSPSSGQEGVKGLRWRINTLVPAEEKQLKFRVKVK